MKPAIGIFDIDGTLRRVVDPWLHLHRHLGTEKQGEAIYQRWVTREVSYSEMTKLDASMWRNVSRKEMMASITSNPLRKGAEHLIRWFKMQGTPCVGISTGLAIFNDLTAQELGLDEVVSNEIVFDGDVCTGDVIINVEENTKAQVMKQVLKRYGINQGTIITFGDGQSDIPMFECASLSVAVFPRSSEVREKADLVIESEPIHQIIKEFG